MASGQTKQQLSATAGTPARDDATRTKTEQLRALLTKPHGARISTLCATLGWQKHTVRAAISRLRKTGAVVLCQTVEKSGEAKYWIDRAPQWRAAADVEAPEAPCAARP